MDADEVTLDWGGNDDDEGTHQLTQQRSGKVRQDGTVAKDEATLSGAESLLALAFGGASADAQDDKDSDVVSLGGGDDDMEELYAYQSRTHLGGAASGDPKSNVPAQFSPKPTEGANSEDQKTQKALAAPPSQAVSQNAKLVPNEPTDSSRPHVKPNSQTKSQANENTRSPATTKLAPPTGPLALPPKPVATPTTPYVRPSHPSIMSASSMAAPSRERDRDLQRDNHDGAKGKHGPHGHVSPENDGLQLAPGWEMRRARDGTQDIYYYNTKTQQSTWNRSVATGTSSSRPEGSASPAYTRGRVKEQVQPSEQESPVPQLGLQPRNRPTRFDSIRIEPNVPPTASVLTFDERHYRPNDNRSPPPSPPFGNGDLPLQRQSRGGSGPPSMKHDLSSANRPVHPTSHRGNDRDFPVLNRVQGIQGRHRDDRAPPPFGDRVPGRNGERHVERERSRSPGRGRSQNLWPNEIVSNLWGRDAPVSSSNERRAPTVLEGSRQHYGGSPPPSLYRGAPQVTRSSSLGREDRSRYPPPNHDQSSFRDRHRTPPLPERPAKRTRSRSPPINNSQRQAFRPTPSQPLRNNRWGDDMNQTRQRDQSIPFGNQVRDRPSHHHPPEGPPVFTPMPFTDRVRNGGGELDRSRGRESDRENDAKRQKIIDDPDSAAARRLHRPVVHDDRDSRLEEAPRRKRQPLPPQSERFKEMASPTQPPVVPPRSVSNGALPSATPSGPRRSLPTREANISDTSQQGRPTRFAPFQRKDFEETRLQIGNNSQGRFIDTNDGSVEAKYHDGRGGGRQWERERERAFPTDLPTGPRAMDLDAEPPMFVRRGRSPPRQQRTDRSPPPHNAAGGSRKFDQREDLSFNGPRRPFGATDRGFREQERQFAPRAEEVYENNRPRLAMPDSLPSKPRFNQQQHRPAFNTSGANDMHVSTRNLGTGQASPADALRSIPARLRPEAPDTSQELPTAGDRQVRKMHGHDSFSQDPNKQTRFGGPEGPRRASFSGTPSSDAPSQSLRPVPQASLSPLNETRPLPGSSQRPRPRIQPSYPSSSRPSLDRPLLPEEEDIQAVWDRSDHSASHSPVEPREAFSDNPNAEYKVASPPPSRTTSVASPQPRDQLEGRESQRSRSLQAVGIPSMAIGHDNSRQEGPSQPLMTPGDDASLRGKPREIIEFPPRVQTASGGTQPERTRIYNNAPRPSSPPLGSRNVRIRRPSKLPDQSTPSFENAGPAGGVQPQGSRLSRQGSLLDRLSNPSSMPSTPPLRDRVSSPGDNWKRNVAGSHLGSGASLRDRLEDVGDARQPMNVDWNHPPEDAGAGANWRDRQNRRNWPRRGRGQ